VDQHTAIHIFNNCIRGMLRNKAVLWITHQLELLPQCDKIAVMEGGRVTYFGPYDAEVLNQRLPVDHLLFATVEAGDAAVKGSENPTPAGSTHGTNGAANGTAARGSASGTAPKRYSKRKSFQRSGVDGMRPVDSVVGALSELAKHEGEELEEEGEEVEEEAAGEGHTSAQRTSDVRRHSKVRQCITLVPLGTRNLNRTCSMKSRCRSSVPACHLLFALL
jgi:ABC-type multidrug transport system ATPase subunit